MYEFSRLPAPRFSPLFFLCHVSRCPHPPPCPPTKRKQTWTPGRDRRVSCLKMLALSRQVSYCLLLWKPFNNFLLVFQSSRLVSLACAIYLHVGSRWSPRLTWILIRQAVGKPLRSWTRRFKALVNEDTLLRTHCCPWCFLGCANWETFAADTNVSEQNQKHFLCPGHKICVRNKCCARGQTGKHLCRQQCVRTNVSSFARANKTKTFCARHAIFHLRDETWEALPRAVLLRFFVTRGLKYNLCPFRCYMNKKKLLTGVWESGTCTLPH